MNSFADGTGAVWTPALETVRDSHLQKIMDRLDVGDIETLHALALLEPEQYYRALIEHLDLRFSEPFDRLVDTERGKEFPRWFPGGRLNIVESCLGYKGQESKDRAAVRVVCEGQARAQSLNFAALRTETQKLANFLSDIGIKPGDCVGLFLPMTVEATVAFFACAWVGAVAVPAFSGYGPEALKVRLQDAGAKLLITTSGFLRRGTWIDMRTVAGAAVSSLDSLSHVICVDGDDGVDGEAGATWISWDGALSRGAQVPAIAPRSMDPNDALLLMYTSGTTGSPKGIVHSHGGFLVKVVSDFAIAFDVGSDDRFCWITDLGWLVGPQMIVGTAALGATAVYYVGALDMPDTEQIWRICDQERITILGLSPTAVRTMAVASPDGPSSGHDLSSLQSFVSTGEPWNSTSWRWLFDKAGQGRRPILNYSGGTEVAGGILTSYAALPVTECAFTGPVVGMDADIVHTSGQTDCEAVGELVVRNIWPGMTHSFWGGDDRRYIETYWSTYPGIWRHGDLAQRNPQGWWYICGRSDDTLKVAGRRIGPVEIENALLRSDDIVEAAVVGIPDDIKGHAIIAFVIAANGATVSAEGLRQDVRSSLGPSMVPSEIHVIAALPKTRNGKIVRRALAARYLGQAGGDFSTLDNAEALADIPQGARRSTED